MSPKDDPCDHCHAGPDRPCRLPSGQLYMDRKTGGPAYHTARRGVSGANPPSGPIGPDGKPMRSQDLPQIRVSPDALATIREMGDCANEAGWKVLDGLLFEDEAPE